MWQSLQGKFRRWYYFRRYGICPDHLILCRSGGGYEPKWICDMCDQENRVKHEQNIASYIEERQAALERAKGFEQPH